MSYPEVVYHGDGEASAWRRSADAGPDLVYPEGTRVHHLVRGDQSGGLFGLYRWEMAGPPTGPGPHLHRTITETFHVLEGQVLIYDGRAWVGCGPGDTVHVPIGGVHGFRNESGEPATMLLHFSPGAPREAYFAGIPRLADMAPEEIADFFAAHDNEWVDGPPAVPRRP